MIFRKLQTSIKRQGGFTLIEILASIAITGLIGAGAAMVNAQMLEQTSRNSDITTASRHTLNAIDWISTDTQMAQNIDPDGASGFPLTLSWTEWDNTEHTVVYSLDGSSLSRNHSIDGGASVVTLIAEHINPNADMTNCVSDNGVLTLTVTASLGNGTGAIDVTKAREITSRPNL
jgi:prepilin-type N-terminal cleavage/methylation domain-containing protein